ncbi:MAG: hypothetical protein ACRDSH_16575 [Pseudonocardiaceae bacterium]
MGCRARLFVPARALPWRERFAQRRRYVLHRRRPGHRGLAHRDFLLGHRDLLGSWRCLGSRMYLGSWRRLGCRRSGGQGCAPLRWGPDRGRGLLGSGLGSACFEWNSGRRSGVEGDLLVTGGLVLLRYDEGAQPADRRHGGRQKGHQHFIRTNPASVHLRPPPGSTPRESNQTYLDEMMEICGGNHRKICER